MMKKTLFIILFFVFILTGCTIESFIVAGDVPPTESPGHSVYYKIGIDHSEYEPSHSSEGVTLTVCEYSHSGAIYNNGETEEPELTVLQFKLKCDTQGLEEQDGFRLYRNEDGEFVDITEPTEFAVDVMAGSLIKNPGGGLALSGGYIEGGEDCKTNVKGIFVAGDVRTKKVRQLTTACADGAVAALAAVDFIKLG